MTQSASTELQPLVLAPWHSRLLAWCVDFLVAGGAALLIVWMLATSNLITTGNLAFLILMLLFVAFYLIINLYLLDRYGQTLGKRLMDLAIVDRTTWQLVPLLKLLTLRLAAASLSVILLLLVGVLAQSLMILLAAILLLVLDRALIFRSDRLCAHDHLCGTVVIRVPKGQPWRPAAAEKGWGERNSIAIETPSAATGGNDASEVAVPAGQAGVAVDAPAVQHQPRQNIGLGKAVTASGHTRFWAALLDLAFISLITTMVFSAIGIEEFPIPLLEEADLNSEEYLKRREESSITIVLEFRDLYEALEFQRYLLFSVMGGAYLLLNSYMLARFGQTMGKTLLGIAIVSSRTGRLVSYFRLIVLRELPVFALLLFFPWGLLVWFVDKLFIFVGNNRCLRDYLSGTCVISTWPHDSRFGD